MSMLSKTSVSGRFTVYHLTSDDVLSFKHWWPISYRRITNSNETSGREVPRERKKPFKVSSYKQFLYYKDTSGQVVTKAFVGGFSSTFAQLKTDSPPELPSEKAYPLGKVPINKKKVKDLKKLMNYTVSYEDFYDSIIQWRTTEREPAEDMPEAE